MLPPRRREISSRAIRTETALQRVAKQQSWKLLNLAGYNEYASLIACGRMLAKTSLKRSIDVRMWISVG
jgi:hypothetical protein